MYPRLALAAVDTALISGALAGPTEDEFVRAVEQSDILRFRRPLHGPGGYFEHVGELLNKVHAEVREAATCRTSFMG